MTEKELLAQNPWKEVAKMYNPYEEDCLFSKTRQYVCSSDLPEIEKFNSKLVLNNSDKDDTDKIITNIPAEPWSGNPLTANLIILSLNPGYVPEVNKTLALLLQSNKQIRKNIIEFKRDTLLLKAKSFMADNDGDNPISSKDAVNMLGDWYWYKKLKQLKDDVGLDDYTFFRKIALIEFHGYSSITSNRSFPLGKIYLESQLFTKRMIQYIVQRDDVVFLIMRSKKKWIDFLGKEFMNEYKDKFVIKDNKGMSQSITRDNLDGKGNSDGEKYRILKNILK